MRIGMGYDIHRLVKGRQLVLGGVSIPYEKGLLGHSDADVLTHAICDALLGASGEGDIGIHFPDNDVDYKDISSLVLLEKTYRMIVRKGFTVINIDTIIFAEAPKLSPYRNAMREKIAATLDIASNCVNIKSTTSEGLGPIGRGEGIAAMSVVLLK